MGARAADMDNDGDNDILSICWVNSRHLHLWRNNAVSGTVAVAPTNRYAAGSVRQPTRLVIAGNRVGVLNRLQASPTGAQPAYYTVQGQHRSRQPLHS